MLKSVGKGLGLIFRPGFTKANSNPFEVCSQGAELVRRSYASKKSGIQKEKDGIEGVKRSFKDAGASPETKFSAWAKAYDVAEEDYLVLEHQQNVMGLLNYLVLILGLILMAHIANPANETFISAFTKEHKILFIFADILFCVSAFLRALKYMHYKHSIKARALLDFRYTLFNFKRWL